jgi:Ca-activated chloride channel homolog
MEKRSAKMQNTRKSLYSLLVLIALVGFVLAYAASGKNVLAGLRHPGPLPEEPVTVHTDLVQEKVLTGSSGEIAVSMTLTAVRVPQPESVPEEPADLVIVLDRSGSMEGQKIGDACRAVQSLIDRLTNRDRLALITYSDNVQSVTPLIPMDAAHRMQVKAAVQAIYAGGGTNLGGGLQMGLETLMKAPVVGRQRKVILISDGLANHGVTDPDALGRMAGNAVEQNFTVSTVGVGYDFNEILMTTIADHGAGRYYFLENPNAFARIFEKEFESTRHVAASGLEIRVPLANGLHLVDAGGYPVQVKDGCALVHPGDLISGQQRKLFLTFKVPTDRVGRIDLGAFDVSYRHGGTAYRLHGGDNLSVACVADKKAVISSIDQTTWGDQVVQDDYNRLKEDVAASIRKGERDQALKQIQDYETDKRAINATVGSAKVTKNLDKDLMGLRQSVEETFTGSPAAVAEKKKQNSKALQYEGYRMRRDKK